MKTIRYESGDVAAVANALSRGEVIAFPSDTVFGLGCVYDQEEALKALKWAKNRDGKKPIPLMVSSLQQMEDLAYVNLQARALIAHFMPGPLSIILKRRASVPAFVCDGLDQIAMRIPDDLFILEVMKVLNKPLLVSSANLANHTPGKNHEAVLQQLDGRIAGIVMGESGSLKPSSIVDARFKELKVMREGAIATTDIFAFLKGV